MKTITRTRTAQETIELGEKLAGELKGGEIISLEGDLAAGKTTFTKGLAKGLGITDTVNSPTFTILKEYEGRLKLKHIDAYRLEGALWDSLGFYDLFDDNTVVMIEWPKYLDDLDLEYDYVISFKVLSDTEREIEVIKC